MAAGSFFQGQELIFLQINLALGLLLNCASEDCACAVTHPSNHARSRTRVGWPSWLRRLLCHPYAHLLGCDTVAAAPAHSCLCQQAGQPRVQLGNPMTPLTRECRRQDLGLC